MANNTIEKVLWTALPNGYSEDQQLRISVFVAPRLSNANGSDTVRALGEFPAFVNWPRRLEAIRFRIEFDDNLSAEATPETAADPDLWERLFLPETPVRPYAFKDHAKRMLHEFPVRGVLDFLQRTYGALGAMGTNFPSIGSIEEPGELLAPFLPLGKITEWISDWIPYKQKLEDLAEQELKSVSFLDELVRGHRQGEEREGGVVYEEVAEEDLDQDSRDAQNHFFQAYRFYYRPGSRRPELGEGYVEPRPKAPDFDFHQMVAQLGDHPAVLRRLGLIVDLVVDRPAGIGENGSVRVVPADGGLPEDPPSPSTYYELDERWFGARPSNRLRMARGLLHLDPEYYDLFQVDVDGAALKVADFANTLGRMLDKGRRGPATPTEIGVPALRSAGLSLANRKRGEQLYMDLDEHHSLNEAVEAGGQVDLYAEDLVRGYRVDVFDEDASDGPRWFSLHQRVAQHSVKDPLGGLPQVIDVTDEGYVKATSASGERADHAEDLADQGASPSDDLYLHQTVFGWEGWSLSAPRPGKRIIEPGEGDHGSTLASYNPEDDNPFPLVSRISAAPRSLPRLRFGHTYRLRARTVDLAGNSRPFSEADLELGPLEAEENELTSEKQTYKRFEPVPSPTVLRKHEDTEGESLEHLVVRSNLGISAADYAASEKVNEARRLANSSEYFEDSQRHLAPPKTSQLMAEQHGCFDGAFGGTPEDRNAALRAALREEGTFLDTKIVDLDTGRKTVEQASISTYPPVEMNEETEEERLPQHRGDGLSRGVYAYYPEAEVLLPYLPDPLAVGVSLTGYDLANNEVFHQVARFPGDWPALQPFRLRLSDAEEEEGASAQFSGGVLEVRLPKAEVIRARLSSVFPGDRRAELAIWDWVPDWAKVGGALTRAAEEGRHWMLTPFRWVTFTHAVQQPLVVPKMTAVTSWRSLGSTFAEFEGPIINHAKSTGRLDVFGEWSEDLDLLSEDEPRFGVPNKAHAFGFDIHSGEDEAQVHIDPEAEAQVRMVAGEDVAEVQTNRRVSRHEFGDTKYRRIVYHSVATTRFREFLPSPIANDPTRIQRVESTTDAENRGLVHYIPSSARPAAPDVLYVLPTFRWERQDQGNPRRHVRLGNAVRVWLRRPWFSSGDGELLGVVLKPRSKPPRGRRWPAPPSPEEVEKMLSSYISSWGSDPVWESARLDQIASAQDFPRHVEYAGELGLEELPERVKVGVAAHEVYYDRRRKLWYCDIEIESGSTYFPFVRLALARYQPHSVSNAELSRVVMTDFVQLAPDRTAELDLRPLSGSAQLTVTGYSGRNILGGSGPNTTMRAALETHMPGIPGDLGWKRLNETELSPSLDGFHVTWAGALDLPHGLEDGSHRIVITEVETHRRDAIANEPAEPDPPDDYVRERVVYADTFEL